VVVTTRPPNSDKQYVWEAEANSSAFLIREETDPDFMLERGTAVILHLKVGSGCWEVFRKGITYLSSGTNSVILFRRMQWTIWILRKFRIL
jgi:hypothetical protein